MAVIIQTYNEEGHLVHDFSNPVAFVDHSFTLTVTSAGVTQVTFAENLDVYPRDSLPVGTLVHGVVAGPYVSAVEITSLNHATKTVFGKLVGFSRYKATSSSPVQYNQIPPGTYVITLIVTMP